MHDRRHSAVSTANDASDDVIPRVVWRRLFTSPPFPATGRIVLIEEAPLAAAGVLSRLPFDLTVFCDAPQAAQEARQTLPTVEVRPFPASERILLPERSVDLLIVLPWRRYASNLLDSGTRLFTASLLAMLRPGARLVFLQRSTVCPAHAPQCWSRHLACFPGKIAAETVRDSLLTASTWNRLTHGQPRRTTQMVTLTTPQEALSATDWRDYTRRSLLTGQRTCCAHAIQTTADTRRAA